MASQLFGRLFGRSQYEAPVETATHEKYNSPLKPAHEINVTESHALVGEPSHSDTNIGHATIDGKEICSSSRIGVLWNFLLFHLPSIAVSAVLFAFHIVGFCWAKAPTGDQLSALQFPAKAHEILVVMSLSDIILHRIMYGLLGKAGLALGFVTAPFHVANPLYLFSPDFWGTVRNPQRSRSFHRTTIALLIILVAVGVTVGPLSATLMTPRQDWVETTPSDQWFADYVIQNPYIYSVTRDPYPKELTTDYAQQAFGVCIQQTTDALEEANEACAVYDIKPFIQEVAALKEVSAGGNRAQYNISITRDGTATPYRPLSTDMMSIAGMATGPMDFVSYDLSRYSVRSGGNRDILFRSLPNSLSSPKLEKWKQPLVAVTCAPGLYDDADEGSLSFEWNDELLTHSLTMTIPEMNEIIVILDNDNVSNAQSFSLHLEDQVPLPLSATLLLSNHTIGEIEEEGMHDTHYEMCHVISRWHEADVWTDTRLPTGAQSELGIKSSKVFEYIKTSRPKMQDVTMSDQWLAWIGPIQPEEDTGIYNTDFASMLDASILQGGDISWTLSKLLALYLADAMTMSTAFAPILRQDVDSVVAGPDDVVTQVSTGAYSHLYTYNFYNTRSRPAAFALLFFHTALVVAHHLIIVLSRKPWHHTGWGSAEELISLALRSRSPEDVKSMENIVTSSAARQMPILIREEEGARRLEMVVAAPDVHPTDVESSAVDPAVRGVMRRVQSGFKYN